MTTEPAKILIVEDDRGLRSMLKTTFEKSEFMVFEASHCRRTKEIMRDHPLDLILLDINLPDGNGLDLLQDIRARTDIPVIIMSGKSDLANKLMGLERGADDYVCKPVQPKELCARIISNIRRYKTVKGLSGSGINDNTISAPHLSGERHNIFSFSRWVLDHDRCQLYSPTGQSAGLTAKEYKILSYLTRQKGKVVRRNELCDFLRNGSYVPAARAVDITIARLRKKIGDDEKDGAGFIRTIRGFGYMFEDGAA